MSALLAPFELNTSLVLHVLFLQTSRIYASVSHATIVSSQGLSFVRFGPLIQIYGDLVSIKTQEQISIKFNSNMDIFKEENPFESLVCEMAPIPSSPQ